MTLQDKIQANTTELHKTYSDLSATDVVFKQSEDTWSILEGLEHIFLINKAVYKVLTTPAKVIESAPVELFGEQKINKLLVINRGFKVGAPDFYKPTGSFISIDTAKQNLNGINNRILNHINTYKIEEETITIKHPMLGEMTKVDWVHFMIAHTNRHILQIEEIKSIVVNK
jgi:hypothetical protein